MDVKKKMEELDKIKKRVATEEEKLKCQCFHTAKGDLDITKDKSAPQGQLRYICRRCRKPLNFNKIREEKYIIEQKDVGKAVHSGMITLLQGIEVVDKSIDVVKITLDPSREDDKRWGQKFAKLQFRLRTEVDPMYKQAIKRNNKGNGRGKGRNANNQYRSNNSGSHWTTGSRR